MACKARLKEDGVYQTGPYDPGVSATLGKIHVKNVGDAAGSMNVRVYEFPGTVNERKIDDFVIYLQPQSDNRYPISGGPVPDNPGGKWPVGVEVWCQTASRPSWSNTNKTHQWNVDIASPSAPPPPPPPPPPAEEGKSAIKCVKVPPDFDPVD